MGNVFGGEPKVATCGELHIAIAGDVKSVVAGQTLQGQV